MTLRRPAHWFYAVALCLLSCTIVFAQDDAMEQIHKYREMLEDGNPAELSELRGEELWTTPRGPNNATLEQCDLGLGPGKLEGAYAQLPRYFSDTGKVQDAESRLVTCMQTLQGMTLEEATRGWYKANSDMEALVTYVAGKSRGSKIDVPARHPREAQLLGIGEQLFFRRAGPLDFACATCHSQDSRRIRLQEVPNFAEGDGARHTMAVWPAYRLSQGAVWTMERRLIDCIRQMRWPEPEYGSDALIALQLYLQHNASGAVMKAPGMKR